MNITLTRELVVERDGEITVQGLPVHAGDAVKVLVIPKQIRDPATDRYPLRGAVIRYDHPFEPAIDPNDWEANR